MYLNRNGYQIYYEVTGSGSPVVFIHGLGGSTKQIDNLITLIPGCQIIKIDMQAHGFSGHNKELSFNSMADDVIAVTDSLLIKSFSIGGSSMGAAIALNLTLRYPDRINKLFCIRSAWLDGPLPKFFIDYYSLLSKCLEENDFESFLESEEYKTLYDKNQGLAESTLNAYTDSASLMYPEKYEIISKLSPFDLVDDLRYIKAQTLILWCKDDPLHPKDVSQIIADKIIYSRIYQVTSPYQDRNKFNADVMERLINFL